MEKQLKIKHERITIDKLQGNDITAVHIFDVNPPVVKTSYGTYGGKGLVQGRIVITHIRNQDSNKPFYYIEFYTAKDNFKQKFTNYVSANFEVAKLTGSTGVKMIKDFKDYKVNRLQEELKKVNDRVGSDPEIFAVDENNQLIPAFNFLKSKTAPDRLLTQENLGVYWDGFQGEFETRADTCLQRHTDSVHYGLKALLQKLRQYNGKAKLTIKTVMDIPPPLLRESNEEFVALGCMPSFNVYNLTGERMDNGRELPIRSAGGHIHFGLRENDKKKIPEMVKALDAILGVACVAMFAKYDDPRRRRYYGLAGEYRTPAHGMEYRVLSNAWLIHPFIMNLTFDVSRMAAAMGFYGYMEYWKATEKETIDCINTCDVAKAQEILDRNKDLFIQVIGAAYPNMRDSQPHMEKLFSIFRNGMDKVIEGEDIDKNWMLSNGAWRSLGEAQDKNVSTGSRTLVENPLKKLA